MSKMEMECYKCGGHLCYKGMEHGTAFFICSKCGKSIELVQCKKCGRR